MSSRKHFWVFIDKPTKKAKLHLSTCGACRNGHGMHGHRDISICWWKGFSTRREAWNYALEQAREFKALPSTCRLCHP